MKRNTMKLLLAVTASSMMLANSEISLSEAELAKHLGDQFNLTKEELRGGSTGAVTDVFYNIPITNTKLSTSGSATYGIELKQSGRYYIANNLNRALAANIPFIKISGIDIILDMNACTIQGGLQTTSSTASGITVSANLTNIRIINGSITNIQGAGISIGTGCDSIVLEEITVAKYQDNGIEFNGSTKNISLSKVNVTTSTGTTGVARGFYASGITTGIIENCSFNNAVSNPTDAATGASFFGCNDIKIIGSEANGATGSGTGGNAYGWEFSSSCSGIRMNNCTALNNTASGAANGIGFYLVSISDSVFENCSAMGNSGANTSSSSLSAGFYLAAGTGNEFINCASLSNTTSGNHSSNAHGVAGFYCASNNNSFINCRANTNSSTDATASNVGIAYGFYLSGVTNNKLSGCVAQGNSCSANAGSVYGIFSTGGGTSNIIDNCQSNGNFTSIAGFSGTIAGIAFGDSESFSTISNCSVIGNAYTYTGSTNSTGSVYGILLGASTTGVSKCSVMRNSVRSTSVKYTGTANMTLAGLRDFTTDSNSLIAGNVLALNGNSRLNIGSAPNYDIVSTDLNANATTGGLNIYLTYDNDQNVADIVVETDVSNMQALSTGLEGWTNYLVVPQQAS